MKDSKGKDIRLYEKDLEILYGFLNLEWDDMPTEVREEWEKILIEIENKYDETNKDLRT